MKNYTIAEIRYLIERFENQKLPKSEWTHEAHLVVAIWYSAQSDLCTALEQVRNYITAHNTSVGTPNTDHEGYHETITKFWLWIAQGFIRNNTAANMEKLVNDFINSPDGVSNYPLSFYSESLLFSVHARHFWVEPDLKDLPEIDL